MRITIRCKSLREVSADGAMPCNITGIAQQEEFKTYVEASFESKHKQRDINFYISMPIELLDDNMKIGDEYELVVK